MTTTYDGVEVVLEGSYVGARFHNCLLNYAGQPVDIRGVQVSGRTELRFVGSAVPTLNFLGQVAQLIDLGAAIGVIPGLMPVAQFLRTLHALGEERGNAAVGMTQRAMASGKAVVAAGEQGRLEGIEEAVRLLRLVEDLPREQLIELVLRLKDIKP